MKKILFLLVLVPFFFGCEKEKKEIEPIYKVTITNNSSSPYRFRLFEKDLVVKEITLAGREQGSIVLKNNIYYEWDVLQISGYLIYPTRLNGSFFSDRDRFISFP